MPYPSFVFRTGENASSSANTHFYEVRDSVLLAFEGIWNFFLYTRVRFVDGYFPAAWGAAVNRNDQYLSHAADCQLMACMTRDESERLTWLEMAKTWLQLVVLPHHTSLSPFDKNTSLSRADRNHFGNAA
jgi:hypothetical protein